MAAAMISLVSFSAQAAQTTKMEQSMLDNFPASIGYWQRAEVVNFEDTDPGLGVGINYVLNDIVASIYIYNLGFQSIPSGVNSKQLKSEFKASEDAIFQLQEKGIYMSVKKQDEGRVKFGGARNKLVFKYGEYKLTANDENKSSWLFLTAVRNHYFKVRLSYQVGTLTASDRYEFLGKVVDLVMSL
jgi:hypothetical protein